MMARMKLEWKGGGGGRRQEGDLIQCLRHPYVYRDSEMILAISRRRK